MFLEWNIPISNVPKNVPNVPIMIKCSYIPYSYFIPCSYNGIFLLLNVPKNDPNVPTMNKSS